MCKKRTKCCSWCLMLMHTIELALIATPSARSQLFMYLSPDIALRAYLSMFIALASIRVHTVRRYVCGANYFFSPILMFKLRYMHKNGHSNSFWWNSKSYIHPRHIIDALSGIYCDKRDYLEEIDHFHCFDKPSTVVDAAVEIVHQNHFESGPAM